METPLKLLSPDVIRSSKLYVLVASFTSVPYELITVAQALRMFIVS